MADTNRVNLPVSFYLSTGTILKALDADINSRCFVEGEKLVKAQHIILAGIKEKTLAKLTVIGQVLQTSSIQSHPHTVSFTLHKIQDSFIVGDCKCTCASGKSEKCKHISALLLFCYRTDIESLQELSCTDIVCAWISKRKGYSMYETVPLKNFVISQ